MLWGAIIGMTIGIIVALVRVLLAKGEPCPRCEEPLPLPWFRPLRRCPACGKPLVRKQTRGPEAGAGSWLPGVVTITLAVVGLALVAIFLPGALESRRVWLYQEGRVEETRRELSELEHRPDARSRLRAGELTEQLQKSGWNPQTFRDEYYLRATAAGMGVACLMVAAGIGLLWWRGRSRTEPEAME